MSLSTVQRERRLNALIKEALQSGMLPNFSLLLESIAQEEFGKPAFSPVAIYDRNTFPVERHNEMIKALKADLELLFQQTVGQTERLLRGYSYYETRRQALSYQLASLADKLENLLLIKKSSAGYIYSLYDTFLDFAKIDLTQTTANVDLERQAVCLNHRADSKKKYDLRSSRAEFNVVIDDSIISNEVAIGTSIDNIFDDTVNTIWQQDVVRTTNGKLKGTLKVAFTAPVFTNQITLDFIAAKPMNVKVSYTTDGQNYTLLKAARVESALIVNCTDYGITGLQIEMEKEEADVEESHPTGRAFRYQFGLRNISIYNMTYNLAGVLVSVPHKLEGAIPDKVSLDIDAIIPPGTSIKHSVALVEVDTNEQPVIPPTWVPIASIDDQTSLYPQVVDFGNIVTRTDSYRLPKDRSADEYELGQCRVNGIRFYELGKLPQGLTAIANSHILRRGKNAWTVDSYILERAGSALTLSAWEQGRAEAITTLESTYQTFTQSRSGEIVPPRMSSTVNYRYSCGLFFNKAKMVETYLRSDMPVSIYLNGQPMNISGSSGSQLKFSFRPGWNTLEVVFYAPNTGVSVDLGVDFTAAADRVFAKTEPMTQKSLFELQYKVPNTDHDSYAIANIGGKDTIVINGYDADLEYELYARYSTTASTQSRLLYKAELSRDADSPALTPQINSYRLLFM